MQQNLSSWQLCELGSKRYSF